MKHKIIKKTWVTVTAAVLILSLTACSSEVSNIGQAREKDSAIASTDIGTELTGSSDGTYDSADTAVVASVDGSKHKITLHNIKTDRNYTLSYDDSTSILNKYGSVMVMDQIQPGMIADVKFMMDSKKLASLKVSSDAWQYDDVTQFNLGCGNSTASIGSGVYHLSDNTPVFSDGDTGEFMDIVEGDVISVSGIGNDICGISVQKGHGYLKLVNDEALIGGWIEVGNEVITTISDNMMLVVPEGTYKVRLYNGDAKADRDVTIERDRETDIDCSDIVSPEPKTGYVEFDITPDDAQLTIDGEVKDTSAPIELEYGVHQITASADGYETVSKYISVGTDMAKLSLTLESADESTEDASSESSSETASAASSSADAVSDESAAIQASSASTVSGNSSSAASTTTDNSVYVDAPTDCSVYLDGTYIGTSPACFTKTTGSHTITFTKKGYVSRTYTVYLYNDGSDITYSFANLVSDGTVSGND